MMSFWTIQDTAWQKDSELGIPLEWSRRNKTFLTLHDPFAAAAKDDFSRLQDSPVFHTFREGSMDLQRLDSSRTLIV
jgi:hypothetical protein